MNNSVAKLQVPARLKKWIVATLAFFRVPANVLSVLAIIAVVVVQVWLKPPVRSLPCPSPSPTPRWPRALRYRCRSPNARFY